MASNVIQILIRARDEASRVVRSVAEALTSLPAKAAALTAGISAALGGLSFGNAVTSAAALEAQLDKVAAKGGYSAAEVEKLKAAAEEIGPRLGVPVQQAAEALEVLAAAGLSAEQNLATLPAVLALAKAEGLGLEAAAALVTDAVTIMGLSFSDAGRVADVLVQGANLATTSAAELGAALKVAGGQAKAAGLDLEQTSAILDTLAKGGIRGAEAGTALRNILGLLADPAGQARQALAALGVSSGDLGEAIAAISKAGPRGEAAIRAFGVEAGPALRGLLAAGVGSIEQYRAGLLAAGGTAERVAQQVGSNLAGAWDRLTAAVDRAARSVVEPILAPLTRDLDALSASVRAAATDGTLEQFRAAVVRGFTQSRDAVRDFFAGFSARGVLDQTAATAGRLADALGTVALVARGTAGAIGAVLGGVATTVLGITTAFFGLIAKVGEVKVALRELLHDAGLISDAQLEETRVKAAATIGVYEEFKAKTVGAADATRGALSLLGIQFDATGEQGAQGAQKATAAVNELQGAADTIRAAFEASGAAAQEAAALNEALADGAGAGAAATREAAAAALAEYQRLRDSGTASLQEIIDAWTRYDRLVRQLAPDNAKAIEEAYSKLGVQSSATLRTLADQARQQFETIRDSGTASAGDVQRAFLAYAEKAIAAAKAAGDGSEQVVRSQLAAEAAARGVGDQFERIAGAAAGAGDAAQRAGQQIEQTGQQGGDTLDRIAQGVDTLAAGVTTVESAFAGATAEILSLGAAAGTLFAEKLTGQGFRDIAGGAASVANATGEAANTVESLRARLHDLAEEAAALDRSAGGDFWLRKWLEAANATKRELLEANLAVAEAERSLQGASVRASDLARAQAVAAANARMLGSERLQPLNDAIARAREQVQGLRDDLSSALASAQSELAQLQGNAAEVERLRYEQQTAELRRKTAAAQASGDRQAIADAAELAQVYEQIHKAKQDQARQEAEQQRQQAAEAGRQQQAATATTARSTGAPTTADAAPRVLGVYELKLNAGGQSRTLRTLDNPVDVLGQIERDALRSAR